MNNNFKNIDSKRKKLIFYILKQQIILSLLLIGLIVVTTRSIQLTIFLSGVLIISAFLLIKKIHHISTCTLEVKKVKIFFQKRNLKEGAFFIDDGSRILGLKEELMPFAGDYANILWDPKTRYVIAAKK